VSRRRRWRPSERRSRPFADPLHRAQQQYPWSMPKGTRPNIPRPLGLLLPWDRRLRAVGPLIDVFSWGWSWQPVVLSLPPDCPPLTLSIAPSRMSRHLASCEESGPGLRGERRGEASSRQVSTGSHIGNRVVQRTNTCSSLGRVGAPGRTGKGSRTGPACSCIDAAAGDAERARIESRHPAVTLPAEWHLADGWRRAGIFAEGDERKPSVR
jgi:hypothetical protein